MRCLSASDRVCANISTYLLPEETRLTASWKRRVWILVVMTATVPAWRPVQGAGRSVVVRAHDGRSINALVFEPAMRPAAAVVLVPMLGRPKDDWETVGQRLADANILALAIDLPGGSDPGDSSVLSGWSRDVQSAVAYLAGRSDVRPGAIGIAGASLGASLAARAAAADPSVRSLALISPSIDYRGVRIDSAMKGYGGRPALLIASRHDPYAGRTTRELASDPPGTRETHFSEIAAHGTVLLARDADLVRTLVEWFQRTLG
jgi:dienelactone hydrolase